MQVKSIAECSKRSILQYVQPSLSYQLSLRSLICLFLSGRFTQVLLYVCISSRTFISHVSEEGCDSIKGQGVASSSLKGGTPRVRPDFLHSTGPTKETSQHNIEIVDWNVKNQLKQKVCGGKCLIMSRIRFCHLKRSSICGERKPL